MSAHRILLLALLAVGLVVFLIWDKRSGAGKGDGARFARARDLRALQNVKGIALGYHRGRRLHGELNASVCLIGPSQSGKTLAAVVRAILEWGDRPMVIVSVKGDVLQHTLAAREQLGEVKIFDPSNAQTLRAPSSWSPVAAAETWPEARAIAAGLLQVGTPIDRNDKEPFWRRAAARYLAPLLLAANQVDATMGTVLRWADLMEQEEPLDALERSEDPAARVALEALQSIWRSDPKLQSSVLQTLSTSLDALQEPAVALAVSEPDITPEWLCGGGARTLYVVSPASQQRRLQPLFGGLMTSLIDGALGIAAGRPDGRLDPPLLCVLDEVCNASPLPTLGEYASAGAGQGVLLLSVIQDYSQAIDTWGRERAATIIGNHRGLLVWAGTRDPQTHQYLEGVLGHEQQQRKSRTQQARGGRSTTEATEWRPLVPPHRLRQAKTGQALLVYGTIAPVWTDQPLIFDDRELRRRVLSPSTALEPSRPTRRTRRRNKVAQ